MAKVLIREEPYRGPEELAWDEPTKRRLHFDASDVALLEEGGVLYRGDTAFVLEDAEEVGA